MTTPISQMVMGVVQTAKWKIIGYVHRATPAVDVMVFVAMARFVGQSSAMMAISPMTMGVMSAVKLILGLPARASQVNVLVNAAMNWWLVTSNAMMAT